MGDRPNIIVIHVDALRSDYAGYLARALGKDWRIYEETYTPLYGTDPVLTTVFTGLYPPMHGIIRHGPWVTKTELMVFRLRSRGLWLPEVLHRLGYRTLAFDILGGWRRRGFNEYIDLATLLGILGKARFIALYALLCVSRRLAHMASRNPPTIYPDAASLLSKVYNKLLETRKPFMAFIHLWDTHTPYLASQCSPSKKPHGTPLSKLLSRIEDHEWRRYIATLVAWRATSIEDIVERYRAAACSVGAAIEEFLNQLKDSGLYENTIIVIYSDHGESFGEHGAYFDHHTLHEEVVKSFLAFKPLAGQKLYGERAGLVDVAPTLLGLLASAGAMSSEEYRRLARRMNGVDLSTESARQAATAERPLFFGMVADKPGLDILFGVVKGSMKYVESFMKNRQARCPRCGAVHHSNRELYNIVKDPKEEHNLAKEMPEEAATLRQLLIKHLEASRHPEIRRLLGEA